MTIYKKTYFLSILVYHCLYKWLLCLSICLKIFIKIFTLFVEKYLQNIFLECIKVKFTDLDKNSFFVDKLLIFYCLIQLIVQIVLFLME